MTESEKREHIIKVVLGPVFDDHMDKYRNMTQEEWDKRKREVLSIE